MWMRNKTKVFRFLFCCKKNYFLPPLSKAKRVGKNFFNTIPITVPIVIIIRVAPKYSNKQKNVFFIGKILIHTFSTIVKSTGIWIAYKKNEYPDSFFVAEKKRFEWIILYDSFNIAQHITNVCNVLKKGTLNTKLAKKVNKDIPIVSNQETLSSNAKSFMSKIPQ